MVTTKNNEKMKFALKGVKKLTSLTKTKIRFAKEAETIDTIPSPLPLVKRFSNVSVENVSDAENHLNTIKSRGLCSDADIAIAVLELIDIIEGVKYKYEPQDCLHNIDYEKFKAIEADAITNKKKMNILIMPDDDIDLNKDEINIYVGWKEINGIFLSRVPTSIAPLVEFSLNSPYFSSDGSLRNINVKLYTRTLITNSIYFALKTLGAESEPLL